MRTIAFIANTSGYIYNFRSRLIMSLLKNNYKVMVFASLDEYSVKLVELGCEYFSLTINSKNKNPLKDLSLFNELRRKLKINKPDIILNYTTKPNIYATLAAASVNIRVINNISGLGIAFTRKSLTQLIIKFLYKISQKQADHVFFQNEDDSELFLNSNFVHREKTSILPGSGVDLERFKYTSMPESDKIQFILVARMLYSKGVKVLIDAAKSLYNEGTQNFDIHLLGENGVNNSDAISWEQLEQWNKLPFVIYHGKTDDVLPFIQKAHCMVLPTYYREGVPRSVLESLAIGRPVITTDTPGCRETVLEGENGFLVPAKDVSALKERMKEFLRLNKATKARMGEVSYNLAKSKFDEEFVINAYIEKIRALLN